MDYNVLKGLPKQSSESEEMYRKRVFEEMQPPAKPAVKEVEVEPEPVKRRKKAKRG